MKRFLQITLQVLIWAAILAYLVFAARYCREQQQAGTLATVDIAVRDYDRMQVVSPQTVRRWLQNEGIGLEGTPLEQVNTQHIIETIGAHPFVKDVTAYTQQSGTLHIVVGQRRPVMRVARGDGNDFYISDDRWILPTGTDSPQYVPVVTGEFGLPFEPGWYGALDEVPTEDQKKLNQNYTFLLKLINFVKLVSEDPFWSAELVQIDVKQTPGAPEWREPEIELVPRTGNHIVALGTLDSAREKLDKLALFYRNVLDYEGWDLYSRIEIGYRDQVVCRK